MPPALPCTLLIATRNAHKVGEIRAILGRNLEFLSLTDFPDAPSVVEDAPTFVGNAKKKAIELARWLAELPNPKIDFQNVLVLADDSGLEVDALNGAPGVHSARFAAADTGHPGNSPDGENNAKLLRLLKDIPLEKRTARFRCVLALTPVFPPAHSSAEAGGIDRLDLATAVVDGRCDGRIDFEPRGQGGFGYDPLFVPDGHSQSFAELGEAAKNSLSHRGKALAKLAVVLRAS